MSTNKAKGAQELTGKGLIAYIEMERLGQMATALEKLKRQKKAELDREFGKRRQYVVKGQALAECLDKTNLDEVLKTIKSIGKRRLMRAELEKALIVEKVAVHRDEYLQPETNYDMFVTKELKAK